jgi:hypothetical protein
MLLSNPLLKLLVATLLLLVVASAAQANITLKLREGADEFYFHGQYHGEPFNPADEFEMEIWNCANGQLPNVTSAPQPICPVPGSPGEFEPAQLVYSVLIPGGTCIDRRLSCSFRDRDARAARSGLVQFRVQYDNGRHGNKIWLQSFGDLSLANSAQMYLVIKRNGNSEADLLGAFQPLRSGGWIYRL